MGSTLQEIAQKMVQTGKGIVASDESTNSINKKLEKLNLDTSEETRRKYREIFIGTSGFGSYASGIILFDETIRQSDTMGNTFISLLNKEEVLIGIKVDKGLKDLPNFPGEKYTQGLDDLDVRLKEYYDLGARFTKWRGIIVIGESIPTYESIYANIHALARFAALSQEYGLVPIVEPEVVYKGNHSIELCKTVLTETLRTLFDELNTYKIDLSGIILKTAMVMAGSENPQQSTPTEVAQATIDTLKETVPTEVPGIVFLSGGQGKEQAFKNLSAISKLNDGPWKTTFSYLRALQGDSLDIWQGNDQNIPQARETFMKNLEACSKASLGEY